MKTFVQPGATLDLTAPSGGVVSGQAYKIGSHFGIAAITAAEGLPFTLLTEGVFDTAQAEGAGSGQVWAEGTLIYWDDTAKKFTITSSGNTKVGAAVLAKLTAATAGRVKLIPTL